MVYVLVRPRGYNLGCILAEPIRVNRSFRHGEKFRWEEFELTVVHSPGHTEYQMALFTEIDGARVAFTGEAFFPAAAGAPYQLRHNLVSRSQAARAHLVALRWPAVHSHELVVHVLFALRRWGTRCSFGFRGCWSATP